MFIPYKDDNPTRRFAVVTFLIIIINIGIFLYQIFGSTGFDLFAKQFALIPYELQHGNLPDSNWINPYLSFISYMFIHSSIPHLLFNMLFLWIFGNNIEDVMTRPRFIIFYTIVGIISGAAFVAINPGSNLNLIGASGAISGVLGAYLFLFPFAKVHVLVFIFPIRMPALVFLIIWFLFQISGLLDNQGNVAWISHISGFISGVILHRLFLKK